MINARKKGLGFRSSITSVTDRAQRLTLPGAVDPMQPDALALAVVHDRDRVAVGHAHHAAGEIGGEGLTGKQRKAKEQRQGSNRLGTAHGI